MSGKLQIEEWRSETDGPLNEDNMKRKLKSQGYNSIIYKFSPGTDFPDHTHSYTKKDSIITGRFRLTMYGQDVILKPGDMVEIPANTVHSACVVGSENVIFFDASKTY